jgi:LEA14-like dessication related protein
MDAAASERRRRSPRLRRWLALTLLAGCSSIAGPAIKPPEVTIEGVGLTRPGVISQDLTLSLSVQNRMPRELAVDSISVDLDVNGQRLGSGLLLKTFTLPADAAVSIDVPVRIRTADLLDALGRLGGEKKLSYTLDGRLRLAGTDDGVVAFGDEGELAMPRALPSRVGT